MNATKSILGIAALAFLPAATTQAALVLAIDNATVTAPTTGQELGFVDVFIRESDAGVNEQLISFNTTIRVTPIGTATPGGIVLNAATVPTNHTFVFSGNEGSFQSKQDPAFPDRVQTTVEVSASKINTGIDVGPETGLTGLNKINFSVLPSASGQYLFEIISPTELGEPTGENSPSFTRQAGTLTVVPEPASLGLLAVGGLLALRRRRTA